MPLLMATHVKISKFNPYLLNNRQFHCLSSVNPGNYTSISIYETSLHCLKPEKFAILKGIFINIETKASDFLAIRFSKAVENVSIDIYLFLF